MLAQHADSRERLHPAEPSPISFAAPDWNELDHENQIRLLDVQPGPYRLVINDWQMSRGLFGRVYEARVDATEGKTTWTIPLGAGCITGATQWAIDFRHMVHVVAVGRQSGIIRNAYCDRDGNFCVRYLPPDDYSLWAHDDSAGWCRIPDVVVKNDIHDVGVHELTKGGTITGMIPLSLQGDPAVTVVAVDSHGVLIANPHSQDPIGKGFAISSLWPGEWTLELRKGDQVIAEKVAVLHGYETVACDFFDK